MNDLETPPQITEAGFRVLLKREIARLKDGALTAEQIADDEPLYTIPGECDSRIDLDSLDALELAFAIEEATGMMQPAEWDPKDLLTVDAIVSLVRGSEA